MFGVEEGDATRSFIARAFAEMDGRPVTGVIFVPAPFAPLSTFLRAVPRAMSTLWDEPGGPSMAASGAAHTITLKGKNRYAQLQQWTNRLWPRIVTYVDAECTPISPRIFGGVAFHHDVDGELWSQFGDGQFTLPRFYYGRRGEDAFLGLTFRGDEDSGMVKQARLLEEFDNIFEALHAYEGESTSMHRLTARKPQQVTVQQMLAEDWYVLIDRIKNALGSGRFHKLVAARRCDVTMSNPIDDIDVITALVAEPQCTRFAFRGPEWSFVGASPETLFQKKGRELSTQALAGTIRSLSSEFPVLSRRSAELLGSPKDIVEHDLVVGDIQDSLKPFCDEMDSIRSPEIRKVRNILHLNTPIKAHLRSDAEAIAILAAMHPTPAVGGMPKREAAEWVSESEGGTRGWYTGALGWLDATGDARFIVAIRCGLLSRHRAHVFSGAGIVQDSDADAEYAETELKQLPMLRALGVRD